MTYLECWYADAAAWWSRIPDAELRTRMRGSWCANDASGFANARAEVRRRSRGGSWREHVTTHDDWKPE